MYLDRTYCDFLILAPLSCEIEAMVTALKIVGGRDCSFINNANAFPFPQVIELDFPDQPVDRNKRVIVIQLRYQGVMNAAIDTEIALQFYEPSRVISFGIAGSFANDDAPIGSVIFVTELIYYEPAKYQKGKNGKSEVQSRMQSVPVKQDLLNTFRRLPPNGYTRSHGSFVSGEKLFADGEAPDRKRIGLTNDKFLGVDMEAAGVGCSIDRNHSTVSFYTVKGISDLADTDKNAICDALKTHNRKMAAKNAADSVASLITNSEPVRNAVRPDRTREQQVALDEVKKIVKVVDPYGIKIDERALYQVLLGRRSPIPVYYHWIQHTEGLNWIDFKILCAIAALPRNIVGPVPLATDKYRKEGASWRQTVESMVGCLPITPADIDGNINELSAISRARGLEEKIRRNIVSDIEEKRTTGTAIATLNWMQYMLGQKQHRRMLLFSWKSTYQKWENLNWAFDTSFAIFTWDTFELNGVSDKNEQPNSEICIGPDFESLQKWVRSNPEVKTLHELVNHFRCCAESAQIISRDDTDDRKNAENELRKMELLWTSKFFSKH